MKKLLAVLLLASSSLALADPHHGWQRGYGGAYHHNHHGDWVAPFIGGVVAGAIIYDLNRPRVVVQQPPIYTYPQPIYQYQDVYDSYCNCYRRVLVQIN